MNKFILTIGYVSCAFAYSYFVYFLYKLSSEYYDSKIDPIKLEIANDRHPEIKKGSESQMFSISGYALVFMLHFTIFMSAESSNKQKFLFISILAIVPLIGAYRFFQRVKMINKAYKELKHYRKDL